MLDAQRWQQPIKYMRHLGIVHGVMWRVTWRNKRRDDVDRRRDVTAACVIWWCSSKMCPAHQSSARLAHQFHMSGLEQASLWQFTKHCTLRAIVPHNVARQRSRFCLNNWFQEPRDTLTWFRWGFYLWARLASNWSILQWNAKILTECWKLWKALLALVTCQQAISSGCPEYNSNLGTASVLLRFEKKTNLISSWRH